MGRPSTYTHEITSAICEGIIAGRSIRAICADENMPTCSTVYKWLAERNEFSERYARAREIQAEILADEIVEIADEVMEGVKIKTLPNGKQETVTGDMVERSRLKVDARKWVAAKLLPKKYGDKQTVEHEGKISISFKRDPETPPVTMPTTPNNSP